MFSPCVFVCLCLCLSRCLSRRFNYEWRIRDVIDDFIRLQNRSKYTSSKVNGIAGIIEQLFEIVDPLLSGYLSGNKIYICFSYHSSTLKQYR